MQRVTVDKICRGELTLAQPKDGYRFNVDSVLLVDFVSSIVRSESPRFVVDLGAGCGIVGLLLARRWPGARVLLVELQAELAAIARENTISNQLQARVQTLAVDLRHHEHWSCHGPDLVVSNPPFFKVCTGRVSACEQVALAKHEVACSLEQLLEAGAAGLRTGGSLAMIHSADRLEEIMDQLDRRALGVQELRRVLPMPGRPASRVLLRALKGRDACPQELPALVVANAPGRYTAEMRTILREDDASLGEQ